MNERELLMKGRQHYLAKVTAEQIAKEHGPNDITACACIIFLAAYSGEQHIYSREEYVRLACEAFKNDSRDMEKIEKKRNPKAELSKDG